MREASATGISRAPAVKSRSPAPSWPMPNSARSARSPAPAVEGRAWPAATTAASAPARAAAAGMGTVRCQRTITVAAAKAVAVLRANTSPMREPAAASPHSITTVPRSAALMATQVRPRTRSPRQSQPPNPAMKGERLWMTSVFATEVCARAMMKHVEAVAKQAAISTPGQPVWRTTAASRPRSMIATAAERNAAPNAERQKTVVHGSVVIRRENRPPLLQQSAAAATSQKPRRRAFPCAPSRARALPKLR